MIGLSRLKRAIAGVPTGGMQTGDPKVQLKLCDAQRIEVEHAALIAERDAVLTQNAEFEQRINQFIESISQLSNQVVDLQNTRDDLERQNAELLARIVSLESLRDKEDARLNLITDIVNAVLHNNTTTAPIEAITSISDILDADRDQCLRQIQADAGELGYYNGFKDALAIEPPLTPPTGTAATVDLFAYRVEQASRYAADQYANKIRQGGAS